MCLTRVRCWCCVFLVARKGAKGAEGLGVGVVFFCGTQRRKGRRGIGCWCCIFLVARKGAKDAEGGGSLLKLNSKKNLNQK